MLRGSKKVTFINISRKTTPHLASESELQKRESALSRICHLGMAMDDKSCACSTCRRERECTPYYPVKIVLIFYCCSPSSKERKIEKGSVFEKTMSYGWGGGRQNFIHPVRPAIRRDEE